MISTRGRFRRIRRVLVALSAGTQHAPYPNQCDACSRYYVTCRTCEFRKRGSEFRTRA